MPSDGPAGIVRVPLKEIGEHPDKNGEHTAGVSQGSDRIGTAGSRNIQGGILWQW